MEKEIYCKELVHTVRRLSPTCGRQAVTQESQSVAPVCVLVPKQEKTDVPAWRQSGREKEFFLTPPFILFRPSVDCMKPTTLGRTVSFTQSTVPNIFLIQKHPPSHTQDNVEANIWASRGLVKLTHKINHQKTCCFGWSIWRKSSSIQIRIWKRKHILFWYYTKNQMIVS